MLAIVACLQRLGSELVAVHAPAAAEAQDENRAEPERRNLKLLLKMKALSSAALYMLGRLHWAMTRVLCASELAAAPAQQMAVGLLGAAGTLSKKKHV